MLRSIFTLFLFSILAVWAPLQAQNLIFYQNTQSQAHLFKTGGVGQSAPLVDYFIQNLARGNNKPVSRTEYIFVHDDITRLTKVDALQFDVSVNLANFRLTGDVNYRGFDLGDILVPGAVSFKLLHKDRSGKVKHAWDFGDVLIAQDPSGIVNFRAVDSTGVFTNDIVVVEDKQFIYTDQDRLAFQARIDLIEGYFTDAAKLDGIYSQLKLVNPMLFEQLDAQEQELNRIKALLQPIQAQNYQQQLALTPAKDPQGYVRKMAEITNMIGEKELQVAGTRARIHVMYHERGLAFAQANNGAAARADFQKAVQLQPTFAPAHVQLAKLSYAEGQGGEAVNKLQYVFNELQMDPATRQTATQLGTTMYQNHIGNANYALQKAEHDKALIELDLARNICTRIPAVPCEATLESGYGRAHKGIYNKIVAGGVKLENEKKLIEAEKIGEEALVYHKKFPTYVGEPRAARELLQRVRKARYDGMVAEGERLLKENKLDQAEQITREAVNFQAGYSAEIPNREPALNTLNKIFGARYSLSIKQGIERMQSKEYRSALEQFEAAKAMETGYTFAQDSSLGTKLKLAAKEMVLMDGAEGLKLAKENRLQEARTVAQQFTTMVGRYGLDTELQVVAMQNDLKGAIFSQECTNAANEFKNMVDLGDLKKKQKDYVGASAEWSKAIDHATKNSACGIDTRAVVTSKVEHALPTKYQEQILKANAAHENTNFSGSIETYNGAGDLFYAEDLGTRFGLTHAPLINYVRQTGNKEFALAAAGHFCDKQTLDQALELVYELATKNYPKSRLKGIQARLGKELAIRDKSANPGADPKVTAASYTRAQKSMAGLGKAYVKQWKSM